MRASLLGVLLLPALLPGAAAAVVTVRIDHVSVAPSRADQIVPVDVWCQVDPGDNTNEKLDAFTVAVDAPGATADGIRFLPPVQLPSASHPFVFSNVAGVAPEDFDSTFKRMQVGAAISGEGVDITDARNGLFSIPLFVPGNSMLRPFLLIIDPTATSLGGGADLVAVPGTPGGIAVIPEPTSLSVLSLGLLMLRRRRAA